MYMQEYVSTSRPSTFSRRRKLVRQKMSYDQPGYELEAPDGTDTVYMYI
jgi:hypothetical protein